MLEPPTFWSITLTAEPPPPYLNIELIQDFSEAVVAFKNADSIWCQLLLAENEQTSGQLNTSKKHDRQV